MFNVWKTSIENLLLERALYYSHWNQQYQWSKLLNRVDCWINIQSRCRYEKWTALCNSNIYDIIARKVKWNKKVDEINNHQKELCKKKNVYLIKNSNSVKMRHLKRSKIHLSKKRIGISCFWLIEKRNSKIYDQILFSSQYDKRNSNNWLLFSR